MKEYAMMMSELCSDCKKRYVHLVMSESDILNFALTNHRFPRLDELMRNTGPHVCLITIENKPAQVNHITIYKCEDKDCLLAAHFNGLCEYIGVLIEKQNSKVDMNAEIEQFIKRQNNH